MLIIIEGCDRTGKSTLARNLAARFNAEVRHCGPLTRHPLAEYQQDLDDYIPGSGQHIIYDRHCWGETVWPKIFNRPTLYTPAQHLHTEMFLQSRGAVVIHTDAEEAGIIRRLRGSPPPPDQVGRVLELFDQVCEESPLPVIHFDMAIESVDDTVEQAVELARSAEDLVAPAHEITSHFVGFAPILLVGDEPGPRGQHETEDQTTVPFRPFSGSATYLLEALRQIPLVTLTNTRSRTGPVNLPGLWGRLGQPKLVAIGNEACAKLCTLNLNHGVVPHPQYVRRFWHTRLNRYPDLLMRAIKGEDTREEVRQWT